MQNRAITIGGPINAGKTTVSRLLAERLDAAHIQGDHLRAIFRQRPLHEALPLTITNIATVARNCALAGQDLIIDYPLSRRQYAVISSALDSLVACHAFTLSPRPAIALQRRGDRQPTEAEQERIVTMYEEYLHDPGYGECIDNSEGCDHGLMSHFPSFAPSIQNLQLLINNCKHIIPG